MEEVTLHAVTRENWRDALQLTVHPHQQRFIAEYSPIAALALAKAYIRPGGMSGLPYAIYAGTTMVGFLLLVYDENTTDQFWLFHFFIDKRYQGRGYGRGGLARVIELMRREHPTDTTLQLVVHPENEAALRLYIAAGFRPTGEERWGEPVYHLALSE